MTDLLCCGSCGTIFSLNSFSAFMSHKQKGCPRKYQALYSLLQCYHCDMCSFSPLELVKHVQVVHGINVIKDFPVYLEPDTDNCGTKGKSDDCSIAECRTTDWQSIVNSRSDRVINTDGGCQQECECGMNSKKSGTPSPCDWKLSTQESSSSPQDGLTLDESPQSPMTKRKTCCLLDGGPPCSELSSCPIMGYDDSIDSSEWDSTEKSDAVEVKLGNEIPSEHLTEGVKSVLVCPASSLSSSCKPKFTCDLCGTSFNQKIHLQKHIMSAHHKRKPYKCDICGYATVEKSHLTTHARRHTGERPYACLLCNYRATQHVTLKQHCLKKHQDMFVLCQKCDMRFITSTQFEKHKKFCNK